MRRTLLLSIILYGCASSTEEQDIDDAALDDAKADEACPTVAVPTANSGCPSGRYTPKRESGCIVSYRCTPGPSVTELFDCKTTTKFAGAITTFRPELTDVETTLVSLYFDNPDEPDFYTKPDDSPIRMLADQSDGEIKHRARGLRIFSNSIDIQYTTAFFYASTNYKTGWIRVEDPGNLGVGDHFARFTCTREVE